MCLRSPEHDPIRRHGTGLKGRGSRRHVSSVPTWALLSMRSRISSLRRFAWQRPYACGAIRMVLVRR